MADVSRFSDVEAAKIAVGLEKDGYAFYTAVAARAKDSSARRTLDMLARAEQSHLVKFEALEQQLLLGKAQYWDDPAVTEYIRALIDTAVFPKRFDAAGYAAQMKSEREAFEFALRVEKDSVLFYSLAAGQASEPNARHTFSAIRSEEQRHVVWVSEALSRIPPASG